MAKVFQCALTVELSGMSWKLSDCACYEQVKGGAEFAAAYASYIEVYRMLLCHTFSVIVCMEILGLVIETSTYIYILKCMNYRFFICGSVGHITPPPRRWHLWRRLHGILYAWKCLCFYLYTCRLMFYIYYFFANVYFTVSSWLHPRRCRF